MRKTAALIVFLLLVLAFAYPALAAPAHKAVFVVGQNIYTVDDQPKEMDVAPFVESGRTYVPVRYLAYALGVVEENVAWDEKTQTVTMTLRDDGWATVVKMQVGVPALAIVKEPVPGVETLRYDERAVRTDVAPLLKEGRVYLPARWAAEAFGYEVGWDKNSTAVLIGPKGNLPAPPAPAREITQYLYGKATVVEIPPGAPVRPAVLLAHDQLGKTEPLASMAERAGALVAINGTYFNAYADKPGEPYGTPYGVIIKDGRLIKFGNKRTVVGLTADGRAKMDILSPFIRGGVDGKYEWPDAWFVSRLNAGPPYSPDDEICMFTREYGPETGFDGGTSVIVQKGRVTSIVADRSVPIPEDGFVLVVLKEEALKRFRPGAAVDCRTEYGAREDWSDVVCGLEVGPRLVKDGEVSVDPTAEGFTEPKIVSEPGQRSAIGVKPDGTILLVTVAGVTIYQLAGLMKELGASNAMNLDGGASSGLWYNGRYLTKPGREISNAVAFLPR